MSVEENWKKVKNVCHPTKFFSKVGGQGTLKIIKSYISSFHPEAIENFRTFIFTLSLIKSISKVGRYTQQMTWYETWAIFIIQPTSFVPNERKVNLFLPQTPVISLLIMKLNTDPYVRTTRFFGAQTWNFERLLFLNSLTYLVGFYPTKVLQ